MKRKIIMPAPITHMLVINLHETDFLEETLIALSEEYVRDCVVYDAEGVISRHGDEIPTFGFFRAGVSNFFKEKRNPNCIILAVLREENKESISQKLQKLQTDNRWAASYWFIPIEGYFYHKGPQKIG